MAKTVAVVMGAIFILLGLAGFGLNNLLGLHLTLTHNLIHLASGAVFAVFRLKGSNFAAKYFCVGFGIFYFGLGLVGYWLGYNHNGIVSAGIGDRSRL